MSVFEISFLYSASPTSIMQPNKNRPEETFEILKDIDEYIASVTKDQPV